jgi:ferritin-like protein/TAT (twin-arginine translocation) pathway-exported protein
MAEMSNQLSRRTVLKGSALLAAASALGFTGVFGLRTARAADDDAKTIVTVAATAETFATTHYYRALTDKGLSLNAGEKTYMLAALEAEFDHLQFLKSKGGAALQDKFFFPKGTFSSKKTLGAVTAIAETVFVGAYVAATHSFARLGAPELAAVAAQVAVVEGQHLLFMRGLAGEAVPNNIALADPIFMNVGDAVPVVTPLLDGKKPASGPLAVDFETSAYAYPGDDAVKALIGKGLLTATKPFTDLGGMIATMAATMSK